MITFHDLQSLSVVGLLSQFHSVVVFTSEKYVDTRFTGHVGGYKIMELSLYL